MFRQKFDEVTDCSCRLLPSTKNQYMIFKTSNSNQPQPKKQPKQKYSLKQGNSSNKYDTTKVLSAQKTSLKVNKGSQNKKPIQESNVRRMAAEQRASNVHSPNNAIEKCEKKEFSNNHSAVNVYGQKSTKSHIRTADQKISVRNSHKNINVDKDEFFVSNFSNNKQQSQFFKGSNSPDLSKKGGLENYYKYVSNPYQEMNKDSSNKHTSQKKQFFQTQNLKPKTAKQVAPQKLILEDTKASQLHRKQETQKNRDMNVYQEAPIAKKSSDISEKTRHLTTTMGESELMLVNSGISNKNSQKPTSEKWKPLSEDGIKINCRTKTKTESGHSRKNRKANSNEEVSDSNLIDEDDEDLKKWLSDVNDFFTSKTTSNSNILEKEPKAMLMSQQPQKISILKALEYESESVGLNEQKKLLRDNIEKKLQQQSDTLSKKAVFERLQTMNDLFSHKAECESMIEGEESDDNDTSQVIMTYKNFLEINGESNKDGTLKPIKFKLVDSEEGTENLRANKNVCKGSNSIMTVNDVTATTMAATNVREVDTEAKENCNRTENVSRILSDNKSTLLGTQKKYAFLTKNFNE